MISESKGSAAALYLGGKPLGASQGVVVECLANIRNHRNQKLERQYGDRFYNLFLLQSIQLISSYGDFSTEPVFCELRFLLPILYLSGFKIHSGTVIQNCYIIYQVVLSNFCDDLSQAYLNT